MNISKQNDDIEIIFYVRIQKCNVLTLQQNVLSYHIYAEELKHRKGDPCLLLTLLLHLQVGPSVCPCVVTYLDKYKEAVLRNQWFESKEEAQGSRGFLFNIVQ